MRSLRCAAVVEALAAAGPAAAACGAVASGDIGVERAWSFAAPGPDASCIRDLTLRAAGSTDRAPVGPASPAPSPVIRSVGTGRRPVPVSRPPVPTQVAA